MPNFKKPRGGFSSKFLKKSPLKAASGTADASLMSAVDDAGAKKGHMGSLIEAMGKSERSSQVIDNIQHAIKGGEARDIIMNLLGGGKKKP